MSHFFFSCIMVKKNISAKHHTSFFPTGDDKSTQRRYASQNIYDGNDELGDTNDDDDDDNISAIENVFCRKDSL